MILEPFPKIRIFDSFRFIKIKIGEFARTLPTLTAKMRYQYHQQRDGRAFNETYSDSKHRPVHHRTDKFHHHFQGAAQLNVIRSDPTFVQCP